MKNHRILATAVFLALTIPAAYAAQPVSSVQTQDRFRQMQTIMDQARQAMSPAERQKIMGEHMKLMREQMTSMHDTMAQGGMMGPGGTKGQNSTGAISNAQASSQMKMMHDQMSVMQQMMDQMLQQNEFMMKPAE